MRVSREQKKEEAIRRMKKWGIFSQTIEQFKDDDLVSISEPPFGAFYWVEDEELKEMKRFEEENDALVYCIIRSYTSIGVMDSYMFVSDYKDEWEMDRADQEEGQQVVYVVNRDDPNCSEFGSIGIKRTVAAGLQRIW